MKKKNGETFFKITIEDYKYQIDEISPSRTEVRLIAKNIKGAYKEEFYKLQESIRNVDIFKASDTMVDSLTQLIAKTRAKN